MSNPTEPAANALVLASDVDQATLDAIFTKDPAKDGAYTDAELDALISTYRQHRVQFEASEAQGKRAGKPKAPPKAPIEGKLDLDNLLGSEGK